MVNAKYEQNPKSNKGDKAEKMVVWCASLVNSQDKYDGEEALLQLTVMCACVI